VAPLHDGAMFVAARTRPRCAGRHRRQRSAMPKGAKLHVR